MLRWKLSGGCTAAVGLALVLGASSQGSAAECDENNPYAPALTANIVLSGADAVDETRGELRTFVSTGSLGKVVANVVSASPPGSVRQLLAAPHLSRLSPQYGEQLKGIRIAAAVAPGRRPTRVVVKVRQVCAQYFRNSFLYD